MLDVRGVSKRFGSIQALRDVTFEIDRGQTVAVVGENGAGKSTLVQCIARSIIPDAGSVTLDGAELGRSPRDAIANGVSAVWQDLALCENLDVTSNLFLGREISHAGALSTAAMHSRATSIFRELDVSVPELHRPIQYLSGGQRQLVAIARATLDRPKLLILDEPTAALGLTETATVLRVIEGLRDAGVAIMLVSHQIDEVFQVADRIVVLRHGHAVADLHRSEAHPDDVVAFMSGVAVDSSAGQQLRRLHSLAEQLSEADEGSVLPLTVSSLSGALHADRLAIFMVEPGDDGAMMRCAASLNLPATVIDSLGPIAVGRPDTFLAEAVANRALFVVPELRRRHSDPVADMAVAEGLVGAWAAPIVGQNGVMAVVAGFTDTVAQLQTDQVQLLELFSTMAGAAIERGRLVETLRARNRSLVGLRGVLETLAGPDLLHGGMSTALDALCRGVECEAAALFSCDDGRWVVRASSTASSTSGDDTTTSHMLSVLTGRVFDDGVCVAPFVWSRGDAAVVCLWSTTMVLDELEKVVVGAANSFRLAMEREITVEAEQAAATLHQTRLQERLLTRRLGHELRTPLTAIRGFASTMLQPDVDWPEADKQRFLEIIERESGRMGRLVEQLFDESAIGAGTLRLAFHYCDLIAVLTSAISVAAPGRRVDVDLPASFSVWGDRDRLQQVFVNLIGNALRHNDDATTISITLEHVDGDPMVHVEVADGGACMPADAVDFLNGSSDDRADGDGLGLRLVRGFVRAHGGTTSATVSDRTVVRVDLPIEARQP